jgi:hypothetical protein
LQGFSTQKKGARGLSSGASFERKALIDVDENPRTVPLVPKTAVVIVRDEGLTMMV